MSVLVKRRQRYKGLLSNIQNTKLPLNLTGELLPKNPCLAAQLGIYLKCVHYGILGATLCGIAFVISPCIMVVLIGMTCEPV